MSNQSGLVLLQRSIALAAVLGLAVASRTSANSHAASLGPSAPNAQSPSSAPPSSPPIEPDPPCANCHSAATYLNVHKLQISNTNVVTPMFNSVTSQQKAAVSAYFINQ